MSSPVYLKNGELVKINDHVYCSPSWAVRDGTPYSIARIMAFLPPEGSPKGNEGKNYLFTRVRLAWYYRPSDVSERPVADSRLLLAAIYSEVCDINQLRAKCHVVHRDKITDLAGWKKRPDRFYFNRLFDPYIKKEFEIIQATDVRNLPNNIRETLLSRYEYVVAEKEVIPDLTDTIRLCDTCSDWCSSPETVECARCKKYFHMGCVQPPLPAKPSRGYGWTCAPCTRKHEEQVDSHQVRHVTPVTVKPKSNAPAARGRGRPRKDRSQAEKEENLPIKHFNMWPFRYFGQYTVAEDTLDPDDFIFPRTSTRLGAKFQVNVPLAPGLDACSSELDERGGDSTIELLSCVNSMTAEEVADLELCKRSLTADENLLSNVDWLTEVIHRFSDAAKASRPLSTVNMKSPIRTDKWKKQDMRYKDKEWTKEEVAAFEDAILIYGPELRAIRDEVGTRAISEVIRFYGHWKNSKLGEENQRIREMGSPSKPIGRQYKSVSEASNGQRVGLSDDEGSIVDLGNKPSTCAACRTRESKAWWKAPKGLPTDVLCDTCGTSWRKYADLNMRPLREESIPSNKLKGPEKREGTPLVGPSIKRARTSMSLQPTPPPAQSSVAQIRCVACMKNGPIGKVLKCCKCKFRIHAGTCGAIVEPSAVENWTCELCQNEETLEASVTSTCLLCPRSRSNGKNKTTHPPADSFFRACKPTEGQGWAHVLCSVFIPELTYTDSSRLRLVEGISTITPHRWLTKCSLCNETEGAVLRCSDCPKEYHASCAWKHGHKFGFEIQPVKSSRRDTTTIVTFKGESGCMNAIVTCEDHDRSRRDIYDLCETDDGGETALQVYCQAYKQAQVNQAHGLLRKARRLDSVISVRSENSSASSLQSLSPLDRQCYQCHTQYSPAFHSTIDLDTWVCHQCYFPTTTTRESNTNGVFPSYSDVNSVVMSMHD